ncbi:hypothetical protein KEM60_02936 [Austwickia sp. TVS 96-490-7B]|uniref:hypothetical protein n=1 Tax=Austwickia sp. TVS 96-490-7B TaxID=2830843 RepID=UPI001C56DEE9|nr:hypothetical protein [Austwickia sp. TVS 96-490-7B]MBW3086707.1 hypothetical protein [Austwickia sp. TVS 96-490-7B]
MTSGGVFKKIALVAVAGFVATALAPVQAHAALPGKLEEKHIARLIEQKGVSRHFAELALEFDSQFQEEAKNERGASFNARLRCKGNHLCNKVRNATKPKWDQRLNLFHQLSTEHCADRIQSGHKFKVSFKEFAVKDKKTSFVVDKVGPAQTNNSQQEIMLTIKNDAKFAKASVVGWKVDAKAVENNDKVKAAFGDAWALAVLSDKEATRSVKAQPGESYRLDKGYQQLTATVTAVFESKREPMCDNHRATESKSSMLFNPGEIINQVDSQGKVVREVKPEENVAKPTDRR